MTIDVRTSWMPKYVPTADCVLYLPGQDDPQSSTIKDISGNIHNGTITDANWKRTDKGLWYLYLDGNDYVRITHTASLNLTSAFTLDMWIYFDALGDTETFVNIGNIGNDTCTYAIQKRIDNTIRLFQGTASPTDFITTAATVSAATWYKITATRAGANLCKIYFNGVEKASATIDATVSSTLDLYLGSREGGATQNTTGGMALTKFWNVPLTVEQILYDFNQERHLFGV